MEAFTEKAAMNLEDNNLIITSGNLRVCNPNTFKYLMLLYRKPIHT